MDNDRIEKNIVLRAGLERVWQAITDSAQFGIWFGVALDGPFVAGEDIAGRIVPTQVDPDVARTQEPHRGKPFRIRVERIEPMRLFAFRWHPYAVEPGQDYDAEPMTLVTFALAEIEGGVSLTITESGFAQLPIARRGPAIEANSGGWEHQARLIAKYLARQEEAAPGS